MARTAPPAAAAAAIAVAFTPAAGFAAVILRCAFSIAAFSSSSPSAKPRAMNRIGLFIALALTLIVGLLFGIYPELDLKLAGLFYDPATKSFPLKFSTLAAIARDGAMWIAWGLALPPLVALIVKLVRPDRPLLVSGRAVVFLLITLLLSAGVLTNLTFKSYWGRPRPVDRKSVV